MKAGDVFPGQYLKAADLGGKRVPVVVDRVEGEEIGGEHKAVMYFRGKDKGLVLNKTNWSMLEEITGKEDSDDWDGTRIVLYPAKTDYQGKRVDCIRIDPPPAGSQPAPPPPPPADDDEVPF